MTELSDRLEAIRVAAERHVGVSDYEHLLGSLADFLESGSVDRHEAAAALIGLTQGVDRLPWGAIETLEFTMHRLRWPEVHAALVNLEEHGPNGAVRHNARQLQAAFADDWDGGEIYRAYRQS